MTGPDGHEGPSAANAGGTRPGDLPETTSASEAEAEAADAADTADREDEVFEVLDVSDELAAMAADPAPPSGEEELFAGDPLAVELSDARRERDDYLDALRRLQADFENYKKRVNKHQADTAARAGEALVEKLLPALDTADLAMAHGGGEEVKQVWSTLIDALGSEGLERIAPDGGPFDPTRHDAVAHEPGEGDQEVAEVLRAGYVWKGRVLRPAMVKVRG